MYKGIRKRIREKLRDVQVSSNSMTCIHSHAFPLVHMHGKTGYTFPTWADHLHMSSVKQGNVHISLFFSFFLGVTFHTCENFETLYHKFNDFFKNKSPKF